MHNSSFAATVKKEIELSLLGDEQVHDRELSTLFLSCGVITDPSKGYRLEFHTVKHTPTKALLEKLSSHGVTAHSRTVGGRYVVYVTASEDIEDLLAIMGAQHATLELMTAKIEKDMHNRANRLSNCDLANTERTAKTNAELVQIIEKLEAHGKLSQMPESIKATAEAILENEGGTLADLAEHMNISKSGLYHRIQKLRAAADFGDK